MSEETTTVTTPAPEPTPAEPTQVDKYEALLQANINGLRDYQDRCRRLLEFIAKHHERLVGCQWGCCHIYCQIEIEIGGYDKASYVQNPRVIARRFPGVVWKRAKNPNTCGVLDWQATVEEIPVLIRSAEKIKWLPEPESTVSIKE